MSTMTAIVKDDPVASLRRGLKAYWSFDSYTGFNWDLGGHMAAFVGTKHTATGTVSDLAGNPTLYAGPVGNGLAFNGSSQYVWTPDAPDLRIGATGFTVAGWLNVAALPGAASFPGIFGKDADATRREYHLLLNATTGQFLFDVYDASATLIGRASGPTPTINTWYYVVSWVDIGANTINMQVNNGVVASATLTGTPNPGTSANFEIGRYFGNRYFNGRIDEVGVWNRVLSSAERAALYNGGSGRNAMRAQGSTEAGRSYDPTHSVRFIGDCHWNNPYNPFGSSAINGQQIALDAIVADTTPVTAVVQMGDLVDQYIVASRSDDLHMQDWLASFAAPAYCVAGNHDLDNYNTNDHRTGTQWASDVGLLAKDQVIDLGFATLVIATTDTSIIASSQMTFNSTTLAWLDTTLSGISGDVILVTHAILANTVLKSPAAMGDSWDSTITAMKIAPDASMRTLLTNHDNVVAWISGHSHSPLNSVNLVTTQTFGSNEVLFINASAVAYQAAGPNAGGILTFYLPSLYLSVFPDRFEVRWRDHGTQEWINPTGQWVTTVIR